jgi:hypothetical protein
MKNILLSLAVLTATSTAFAELTNVQFNEKECFALKSEWTEVINLLKNMLVVKAAGIAEQERIVEEIVADSWTLTIGLRDLRGPEIARYAGFSEIINFIPPAYTLNPMDADEMKKLIQQQAAGQSRVIAMREKYLKSYIDSTRDGLHPQSWANYQVEMARLQALRFEDDNLYSLYLTSLDQCRW